MMRDKAAIRQPFFLYLAGGGALLLLYVSGAYDPALFNIFVAVLSVVVAWTAFIAVWDARLSPLNGCFLMVGSALLCAAVFDSFHALALVGVGISRVDDASLAVFYWIAARYFQSLSLFFAPFFCKRKFKAPALLFVGGGALYGILRGGLAAYLVSVVGASPFERINECILLLIFAAAALHMWLQRKRFSPQTLSNLLLASGVMVVVELVFAFGLDVYGALDRLACILKVLAFYLTLRAMAAPSLREPYAQESPALHRAIFEQAADAMALIDAHSGAILEFNAAAHENLGYTRQEFACLTLADIDIQDRGVPRTSAQEAAIFECAQRTKSGELHHVLASYRRLVVSGCSFVVAIWRDISDYYQAKDAYRVLVENSLQGLAVLQGLRIVFVNAAFAAIFGHSRQALLDMAAPDLNRQAIHADERAVLEQRLKAALAGNCGASPAVTRVMRPDGSTRWVENSMLSVTYHGQSAIQVVCVDVTHQVLAEQALRDSELRYRSLFEDTPVGLYRTTPDGRLLDANLTLVKMLGYVDKQTLQQSNVINSHVFPEERKKWQSLIGKKDSGMFHFETRLRRRDGQILWVRDTARAIRDAQGEVLYYAGALEDISAYRAAQEQLRLQSTALETVDSAIMITDRGGVIQWINPAFAHLTGYTTAEVVGQTPRLLRSNRHDLGFYNQMWQTIISGKSWRDEIVNRRKDGTFYDEEMVITPIQDGSGHITHFVAVKQDITARKRAETQLQAYAAELEQRNRENRQFVYIVSHDLRTPLINLKGFSRMLRNAVGGILPLVPEILPYLAETQQHTLAVALERMPAALGFIDDSVARIDVFIGAILQLSRLGSRVLSLKRVDMNAIVDQTLGTLAHRIEKGNVEVIVHPLPAIVADQLSMEQVMSNLLTNAVIYLRPEQPGKIEIGTDSGADEVVFYVRDNGCGIAMQESRHVFVPFRRAGRPDIQGEGLGLAYVQTLVRRHGGRIWFSSEVNKGTTFYFTISIQLKADAVG